MKMTSTKIDMNHRKVSDIEALDEIAEVLFPGNRNHQRIFLAIFVELKWADNQFLAVLEPIPEKYNLSRRSLETVRAKMRRLGLIDHVSRFNKKHGYKEGWTFSNRFTHALSQLAALSQRVRERKNPRQEQKDRNLLTYV